MSTPFDNASNTAVNIFLSHIKKEEMAGTDLDSRKLAALWRDSVEKAEKIDSRKPYSFFNQERSVCIGDDVWENFTRFVNRALGDDAHVDEGMLRRLFDNAALKSYSDANRPTGSGLGQAQTSSASGGIAAPSVSVRLH